MEEDLSSILLETAVRSYTAISAEVNNVSSCLLSPSLVTAAWFSTFYILGNQNIKKLVTYTLATRYKACRGVSGSKNTKYNKARSIRPPHPRIR